jgi:hypothetical protein
MKFPLFPLQSVLIFALCYASNAFANTAAPIPCDDIQEVGTVEWKSSTNVRTTIINRHAEFWQADRILRPNQRPNPFKAPAILSPEVVMVQTDQLPKDIRWLETNLIKNNEAWGFSSTALPGWEGKGWLLYEDDRGCPMLAAFYWSNHGSFDTKRKTFSIQQKRLTPSRQPWFDGMPHIPGESGAIIKPMIRGGWKFTMIKKGQPVQHLLPYRRQMGRMWILSRQSSNDAWNLQRLEPSLYVAGGFGPQLQFSMDGKADETKRMKPTTAGMSEAIGVVSVRSSASEMNYAAWILPAPKPPQPHRVITIKSPDHL